MKFGELKSIGHNIADSLASGICLLVGYYQVDIFDEAANGEEGYICVDFLTGATLGSPVSASLTNAIELYAKKALPDLCRRHGVSVGAFRELAVRYSMTAFGPHFVVTVTDQSGRSETDDFLGVPGKRVLALDALGRIRRRKSVVRCPV